MRTDIYIGVFDLFIFLGVFQGLLLSWFFLKNSKGEKRANLYQGLLLLFLSLGIFEELLNNTGYIVQLLPLTNFSEPLNFTFAPLFYLFIKSSLDPKGKHKIWIHFSLAIFWLFYMYFAFIQPDGAKYNSYVETKHPDWALLSVQEFIDDDPLRIRHYISYLLVVHFVVYMIFTIKILLKKFKSLNQPLFGTDNELLIGLRNITIHFIVIIAVFVISKVVYGFKNDIGGYWVAAYISFMIYTTIYQVLKQSDFFDRPVSFLAFPIPKYEKSSLSESSKVAILSKITLAMEQDLYFTDNLASLNSLSKHIHESRHHVSQVINEKLNKNFFELLASYRVEHAQHIMKEDIESKLTIEELAEMVGYNSKSSFNTAFKKLTSKTPSEYRKSIHIQ